MVGRIDEAWAGYRQQPGTGVLLDPPTFNLIIQQARAKQDPATSDPATPDPSTPTDPAKPQDDAAANVFGPDEPPAGIAVYYPLHVGDNPYDMYRRAGVDLSRDNDDSVLKANLAATRRSTRRPSATARPTRPRPRTTCSPARMAMRSSCWTRPGWASWSRSGSSWPTPRSWFWRRTSWRICGAT